MPAVRSVSGREKEGVHDLSRRTSPLLLPRERERAGDSLILVLPFVSYDLRLFSSTMIVAYTRVIHCLIYRQTSGKSSPPPLEVSPLC